MKAVLRVLMVIAVILPASAASLLWTNTAGGAWSDVANWSPNQVPSASDDVLITQNGTYSVVLNTPTTVASLILGGESGTQTLVMSASSLTAGIFTVRQNGIFDRDGVFQNRDITTATGITVLGRFRLQAPGIKLTGRMTIAEGGQLEILGDLMVSNCALENSGMMTIANRARVLLENDSWIRNFAAGTLSLSNDSSGIQYWADPGNFNQFVVSEGRIRSDNEVFIDVPCTIGGELEVRSGTLDLRRNASYPVAGQNISAAVTVAAGAVLSLRGWGFEFVSPASIGSPGTFRIGVNGTVNLRNGVTCNADNLEIVAGGLLNFETGAPVAINDGLLENGGAITGSDAITISGDFVCRGGSAFRGSGPVFIAPGAFVSLQRSTLEFARPFLVNNGQMSWVSPQFYLGNHTVVTNRGLITITNSPEQVAPTVISPFNIFEDEAIYNEGTIVVGDANATDVRVPVFNSGTVRVEKNRLWFVLAGGYSQSAGRTELAGGNMEFGSPRFSLLGGELTGSGSILNVGTLTNVGGTVSPGISPGRINLTGRYIQQSGATLNIELGGTEPGTGFDQIVAGTSAGLGGTLNLTVANGFAPAPGTRFLILSTPLRSGQFGTVNIPPGVDLRVHYRDDGVEAEFVSGSLVISPNAVSLVSGEMQLFSASLGTPPYTFSIFQNISGGTIDESSGIYLAGPNPGIDTVRVMDALNASAQATVQILPPLQISPGTATRQPGQTETFTASGGSPPYTFSVTQNNSGGDIQASSGVYTAGATGGVTDTVRVTDSVGRIAQATVNVALPALSSISGRVLQAGSPLSAVTITLSGTVQATTSSDATGGFFFGNLPMDGVYSVRPSRAGFVFRPSAAQFDGLAAPGSVEFAAEAVVRIFGRVTDLDGTLVDGAQVVLSGGISRSTRTRAGAYAFDGLPGGGNYSVSVFMDGQDFGPPKTFLRLSTDQQADFTSANSRGSIRGTVTRRDGTPVAGVEIEVISTLLLGAPVQQSTVTGVDGTYEFRDLPLDRSHRVSGSGSFIFRPASHTVSVASAGATANFTVEPAHRISGQISLARGTLEGIEVLFITGNDFVAGRAPVDAQRRFRSPLLPEGTYIVRPQKAGYTFEPGSTEIAVSNADVSAVNFTGDTTFRSILGSVVNTLDQGVPDATVHAIRQNDPFFLRAVTTSAQGAFVLNELPQAPDYILFAHKPNFSIAPQNQEDQFISLGNDDVFGVRFDAVGSYFIRGRVTDPAGAGVPEVVIIGWIGEQNYGLGMFTDENGHYEIGGFSEGINLLVEPEGGIYDPRDREITNLGSDHTVDFVRTVPIHVRGTVRNADGLGIPGVQLPLTGGGGQQSATDVNGRYEFALAGEGQSYTLTPSRPGFTFNPPAVTFTAETGDLSFDFVASPALALSGRIAFALQVTARTEELAIMNADSGALVPVLQASLPGLSDSPGEAGSLEPDCPDEFDFFCGIEGLAAGFAGVVPNDSRFNENNLQQSPPFSSKTLALSPDGHHVLFASFSGSGVDRPFESELDELTGILRTVEVGVPGSAAQVGDDGSTLQVGISIRGKPSWSQNGARVAYSAQNGIFVISPDAGSGTRVSGTDGRDLDPALSPDGTMVAFARREADGTYNLYRINVNGAGLLRLTSNAGNDRYPAWSPNGENLAFASDRDGDYDIFFLENQQLQQFRQTSNSDVDELHPTWSPDGTMLAFQRTGPSAIGGDPGPSFIWVKPVHLPAASLEIPLMAGRRPSWSATPTIHTPASGQPLTIGSGAVSITFGAVNGSGGETTVIPGSPVDPADLPSGYFAIDGSLLTYEISTTASFPPPATVCFTLRDIPEDRESDFNALRILHAENGTLQDRTILSGALAPNFPLRQICASVNSFSPFVLARTADLSRPMIFGKALDQAGNPLPGVTVRLSGGATRTTVTDSDGGYLFAELESGTNYLVAPLDVNLAFAPSFAVVDNPTNTVLIPFLAFPKPAPELSVTVDEDSPARVRLSWPAQSPNVVLEATASLTTPAWIPVPEAAKLLGASVVVQVDTTGKRFFRLRRQ